MDLNIILDKHNKWLNNEPDGEQANLKGANLKGANLDFSCWPLSCNSHNIQVDIEFTKQLAMQFTWLVCDDPIFLEAQKYMREYCKNVVVKKRHNLKD